MDDTSRIILSAGEFTEATTEHSIETLHEAMLAASGYNSAIREVNTDRGSQFYSNHPDSVSVFQQFLLDSGIRHIPSSAVHATDKSDHTRKMAFTIAGR